MPQPSCRDRVEEALARIADPKGEGARVCLTVYGDSARAAAARSFVPWGFGNRRPWSTGRPRADRKQWPGQLHQTLFLVGMGYADDGSLPVIFAMASLVQ